MSSTKNIAKNSLFLYLRMFLNMGVGLFTAGIVLNTLGITDYGIYNIVGGFVSMFGFLNSSMSSATQRFLSFDLGKNDRDQLRKTFSSAVTIHFVIALIIVLALETFGLWYINNKLNVPTDRMTAVNIVFQFSVFSTFFGIIQVPYNALITAHERFNVYAYISFVEIALRLIILYFLVHVEHDKLVLYAALLFVSSFIIRMIYRIYCRKHFQESQYKFYFDKSYFKVLISFTGWNLFGNIAGVAKGQGNNLLLNIFFGTVLNAAYGITMTIQGVVTNFVSNFQVAVNPQIIKSYSSGNKERSFKLMFQSSKFSFGMMLMMIAPILGSLKFILDQWLKNYPPQSLLFIHLALFTILIDTLSNPLMMGLQATGKVKMYQAVVGILVFLNLPISYILIRVTHQPEMVFITSLILAFVALWFRLYFLKINMKFPVSLFVKEVLFRISILVVAILLIWLGVEQIDLDNQWILFLVKAGILFFSVGILAFQILFNANEKDSIKGMVMVKIKK